jgi:hypothetical protein
VDLAVARAIRQKLAAHHTGDVEFMLEFEEIDQRASYDSACQYSVNIKTRFGKFFPDVAKVVAKMDWSVPALHIQGHQANCMYNFGTAYILATGHFHGETAEVYWPELNQIGTQVTQQSGGHRQDTIMLHHNDWNYKKTMKACVCLLVAFYCDLTPCISLLADGRSAHGGPAVSNPPKGLPGSLCHIRRANYCRGLAIDGQATGPHGSKIYHERIQT